MIGKPNFFDKVLDVIQKYPAILFSVIFFFLLILSLFRYPQSDESHYLIETSFMSSVLADGNWIGNLAVGVHGFLFKLPVAILFMLFGPSIFIATLSNVILASLSCFLFYRILQQYFDEIYLNIVAVIILCTGYHFLFSSITYLREMPALFSLLLFLYLIINKKNKLLIGFSLLLLADAKEHVFFQIIPGFMLWVLYYYFIHLKKKISNDNIFRLFFVDSILYFGPVIVYFVLMFFTGIVPLNPFSSYVLGLISSGFSQISSDFIDVGSFGGSNMNDLKNSTLKSLVKMVMGSYRINASRVVTDQGAPLGIPFLATLVDLILHPTDSYYLKLFLPRVFSFLSIPKLIVIPALITSWISFCKRDDELKKDIVLLFLIFWSFIIIFYLRASHGRYLFAISPIMILFFIQFLRNINNNRKNKIIISVTLCTIVMGLLFEFHYFIIKFVLNLVLMTLLFLILYNNWKGRWNRSALFLFFGLFLGGITLSSTIAASYSLGRGQLKNYLANGYGGEFYKIYKTIDTKSKIWINTDPTLIQFYRRENNINPEYLWALKQWVPKKKMLVTTNNIKTFGFSFKTIDDFKRKISSREFDYVYFMYSTNPKRNYYKQDQVELIRSQKYFNLKDSLRLKDKIVYIFEVNKLEKIQ